MFAECSLVMSGVNTLLFITSLLDKVSPRRLIGAGLVLAVVGLAVLSSDRSAGGWVFGALTHRNDGLMALPLQGDARVAAGPTGLVVPRCLITHCLSGAQSRLQVTPVRTVLSAPH